MDANCAINQKRNSEATARTSREDASIKADVERLQPRFVEAHVEPWFVRVGAGVVGEEVTNALFSIVSP